MATQSISCVANSLLQAHRIVEQLSAVGFAPEEISVLDASEEVPESDSVQKNGAKHPESYGAKHPEGNGRGCEAKKILISVHLKDGCGIWRAEEIFRCAGSESLPPRRSAGERPQSWVNPPLTQTRR